MKQKKAKDLSTRLTLEHLNNLQPPTPPQWYLEEQKRKRQEGKKATNKVLGILYYGAAFGSMLLMFRHYSDLSLRASFLSLSLSIAIIGTWLFYSE